MPYGLRFTSDGSGLAVADFGNDRVSLFRVGDGSFVRHVATGLRTPRDVEECEGGWLVACVDSHTVEFVGGGVGGVGRATLGKEGCGGCHQEDDEDSGHGNTPDSETPQLRTPRRVVRAENSLHGGNFGGICRIRRRGQLTPPAARGRQ